MSEAKTSQGGTTCSRGGRWGSSAVHRKVSCKRRKTCTGSFRNPGQASRISNCAERIRDTSGHLAHRYRKRRSAGAADEEGVSCTRLSGPAADESCTRLYNLPRKVMSFADSSPGAQLRPSGPRCRQNQIDLSGLLRLIGEDQRACRNVSYLPNEGWPRICRAATAQPDAAPAYQSGRPWCLCRRTAGLPCSALLGKHTVTLGGDQQKAWTSTSLSRTIRRTLAS